MPQSINAVLFIILLVLLVPLQASGSGGAAAALMILQMRDRDREDPVPTPNGADGFVIAKQWYVAAGGEFRICPTRIHQQRIVAKRGGCYAKIRHEDGFFALSWKAYHYEYERVGDGQALQTFLDREIGPGLTRFVSVAPRSSRDNWLLVFYRLIDSKKNEQGEKP